MTLWIRTQDKIQLLAVDSLLVDDKQILTFAPMYRILGEYATRERALEVLDEIQNMLIPRYILDTSACDEKMEDDITALFSKQNAYKVMPTDNMNMQVISANETVYQMPKE